MLLCLFLESNGSLVYAVNLSKTKKPWREAKVSAVRTKLELVSVTLCITTIFITLFLLCSQFVASIEYFEST